MESARSGSPLTVDDGSSQLGLCNRARQVVATYGMVLPCISLCVVLSTDVLVFVPADNAWHTNSMAALAALFTPDHGDSDDGDAPDLTHSFYEVDDVIDFMNDSYAKWTQVGDDAAGTYFYPLGPDGLRLQPEMSVSLKRNGTYRDLLVNPTESTATRGVHCTLSDDNPFGPFISYVANRTAVQAATGFAERPKQQPAMRQRRSRRRRGRALLQQRGTDRLRQSARLRAEMRQAAVSQPLVRADQDDDCNGVHGIFGKVSNVVVHLSVRSIRLNDGMGLPSCHHWDLWQTYDFSARTGAIQFKLTYATGRCALDVDVEAVWRSAYVWLNLLIITIAVSDVTGFVLRAWQGRFDYSESRSAARKVCRAADAAAVPEGPAKPSPPPSTSADASSCPEVPPAGLYEAMSVDGRWWPATLLKRNADGSYRCRVQTGAGRQHTDEWEGVSPAHLRKLEDFPVGERACTALDASGRWWAATVLKRRPGPAGDLYSVRVHDRIAGDGFAAGSSWEISRVNIHAAALCLWQPPRDGTGATVAPSPPGPGGPLAAGPRHRVSSRGTSRAPHGVTGDDGGPRVGSPPAGDDRSSNDSEEEAERLDAAAKEVIRRASHVGVRWLLLVVVTDLLAICSASLNLRNAFYTGDIPADVLLLQSTLAGFAVFCAWLCALSHLGAWPKFYLLIQTLQRGAPNALRFFAGCFPIFLGYAILGTILFGSYADRFSSLDASFVTLFSVMNGDVIDDTFASIFFQGNAFLEVFSRAYLYSFIALFIYCVLNVFLAIIEDAYFLCKRRLILDLHEFDPAER
eukprot:TRINITY_DN65069_c0_g1_i1.p1 TRINITY_DN65069_c0_g1~~TRINITY_DN65069_c0_g1_i1.p1  ORF type:complete len:828 (+),score=243.64 TRINITY_DN65069_c0_g1_i1:85-2484(+)